MSTQPFLCYLDLDESADERTIRRAYAVRLKKIDQEADPEGFQALRTAYEAAQQWLRGKEDRPLAAQPGASTTPLPEPVGVAPTYPLPEEAPSSEAQDASPVLDPGALASAVFDDFRQQALSSKTSLPDAKRMLQDSLDDGRLMNLEARAIFEWLIARLLLEGWRPGHEVLLVAAIDVFQWESDRTRLLHFGPVGGRMEAALSEREVFSGQADDVQRFHTDWIRQLRTDGHPGEGFLAANMGHVEMLVSRLPNWLWIITRLERLEQWREWAKSVKPIEATPQVSRPTRVQSGIRWTWRGWQIAVAVMIVIRYLSSLVDELPADPPPAQASQPAWPAPILPQQESPQIKLDRYGLPMVNDASGRSVVFPGEAVSTSPAKSIFDIPKSSVNVKELGEASAGGRSVRPASAPSH